LHFIANSGAEGELFGEQVVEQAIIVIYPAGELAEWLKAAVC
jgi:hypothetical protein